MLEMEAVQSHIDYLGSVSGEDGAVYECGVFSDLGQDWLVVVTETGEGTHAALSAVSYAHRAFAPFEVMILVGVGGSRKEEAPIGSVVASDHVYMPYSAKYGAKGRSSRPRSFQPDSRLIGIAKKVRRERKGWPNRIRDPLECVLPARDAYPVDYPPIGLVKPIASIEAVLDDPTSELEALIAEDYGDTYVVEMEGYGAVYAASRERTPSIVVRGVSDMTQGKSPEDDALRQPIAAAHAAAFAFEMLSHWGQIYPRSAGGGDPAPVQLGAPETLATAPSEIVEVAADVTPFVAVTEPEAEPSTPTAAPPVSADVVINLNARMEEATPEWIATLQTALREICGTDDILVVRAAAGSVRLYVADPTGALRAVNRAQLREGLLAKTDVELIGMMSAADAEALDASIADLVAASADLMAWPQTLPDGEWIERPELETLVERVEGQVSSTSVVLGPPGAGKSALLAALAHRYVERGWPVLGIKADALDPDIATDDDLRDRLGLDTSAGTVVERVASFRPILVIIDQLDALAGYLDIRTARLSLLLNLVRRVGRLDNVHVILSARLFEFNHDTRLRAVQAEQVALALPPWSKVVELLDQHGVQAGGWPPDAQELIRTPQALSIYLQLRSSRESEPFDSYQAMLERLWEERVLAGEDGPRRARLLADIADHMAQEESLWLAAARFDDHRADLKALEAAGILTAVDGSVGFSHQTLFDFALARSFAREPGRLSKYVLERQSSLFLRPKLWAGLTYLRGVDRNAYQVELEAIWTAPDLRRHLRFLLIDFLGHEAAPTDREALLMEQALALPAERWRAFRALSGSRGWFERFAHSFISEAMTADDRSADRMMEVLSRAWPFASAKVADLVADRWLPEPAYDARAWVVVQNATDWTDQVTDIACTVVDRTDIAPMMIDHVVATIGIDHPEHALRLVRTRLERQLRIAESEATEKAKVPKPKFDNHEEHFAWFIKNDPKDPIKKLIEERQEWDSLPALAEQSPVVFLDTLWPWFRSTFETLARFAEGREGYLGYPLASEGHFHFDEEQADGLPEPALLHALRVAVEQWAAADKEAFLAWVNVQMGIALAPVQRLVAHAFAHLPVLYAKDALVYLLADRRRFCLGTAGTLSSTTKGLVAASAPHWTPEEVARFEAAVTSFAPPPPDQATPEERRSWRRVLRRVQLDLLRALPKHQMSAAARKRVAEEQRVFGSRDIGSRFTEARMIGSPMDADVIARASDDDIVGAFEALPDVTGWDHPRSFMVGGNIQLSREFATFAAQDPARARRILDRLGPETGTRAAGYVLDAIAEGASGDAVIALLEDVTNRGFDGEEFRGSAARAIEKLVRRRVPVPDAILELLERWLVEPAAKDAGDEGHAADNEDIFDSAVDELTETSDSDGDSDSLLESLVWGHGGLSIVPGGSYPIAEALTRARLARKEGDRLIDTLERYLACDKGVENWDHLLPFLPHVETADPARRTAFLGRLFDEVPGLVGTKMAAHYLANAHWNEAVFVDAQLDRWRDSGSRRARMAYGEIVAIAAVVQPTLDWAQARLEILLDNVAMEDARVGAVHSAANLWADPKHRSRANPILVRGLERGPAAVWPAVFDVFRLVDELSPDAETAALLTTIADRLTGEARVDATFVVERLASLLPHQALLIARVSERLIEHWRDDLGNIQTSTAFAAADLVNLAVTLHRLGPETRDVGTSLFELLIEIESYAAMETLEEIDSRFRARPAPSRRRLPRRQAQARRSRRRVTRPA
nr:hypothetical protein [Sphingobium sp. B2D3D]